MKVGILWTILARNLASGGGKSRNDNVKEGNPQLAEDIAAFKHIQGDCFPCAKANAKTDRGIGGVLAGGELYKAGRTAMSRTQNVRHDRDNALDNCLIRKKFHSVDY